MLLWHLLNAIALCQTAAAQEQFISLSQEFNTILQHLNVIIYMNICVVLCSRCCVIKKPQTCMQNKKQRKNFYLSKIIFHFVKCISLQIKFNM
jgi:5'(3')-deoxyribonucleotidase